ncbi:MAG TPA: hypothetical protein VKN62_01940, partial [Pelovirga sp.]|nr:hypothetical protein [Pelovirga sp.]
ALAIVGAILAAAYMLRLLQSMVWADSDGHGHHDDEQGNGHILKDLNAREIGTLSFLTIFVFWIGFYPTPLLEMMDVSVTHLIDQIGDGLNQAGDDNLHHAFSSWGNKMTGLLTTLKP